MKDFAIIDWWKPLLAGIATFVLSICFWESQEFLCLGDLSDDVLKMSFTYATTMFGLLMAAYTILQGFTNERIELLKQWSFYQRYKMNLLRTLQLLVILGIGSIVCWVCRDAIPTSILKGILAIAVGMVVLTLVSTYEWVSLLIKHFDNNNKKLEPEEIESEN